MCYTCGCNNPDDDHGLGHAGADPNGRAVTNKTFEAAAAADKMNAQEAKKNTAQLLAEQKLG